MNLPELFKERMIRKLGLRDFCEFEAALKMPAPVSFRLNSLKTAKKAQLEPVPWCSTGYYLNERPVFSSDPSWHQGLYYVQEAGSMMLEQAFKVVLDQCQEPIQILDLCASPGGKSTHLASMMRAEDILVSNEVIKGRVNVLDENMSKAGVVNQIITQADSEDFASRQVKFDLILVDAPCSGEGLFRKDPAAINEWSPENINTCELRQRRILDNIVKCIKPGGFLIYSTCTYNPGENEQQVEYLKDHHGFQPVEFSVNSSKVSAFSCLPHQLQSEGFFISLMRKKEGDSIQNPGRKSKFKPVKKSDFPYHWLKKDLSLFEFNQSYRFISDETKDFYDNSGLSEIKTISVGVLAATAREKLVLPSETFVFCSEINMDAIATIELDTSEALKYLSKEPVKYSGNQKGYVLLTFGGLPLGLGKFAGNRINNLFPNEWKLRKMPEPKDFFSMSDLLI